MKFIHAADIHLDSPLRGLSAYADAPAPRLRNATRAAFDNLISLAIEEQVDFMVIAGDVYDGDWKDFNTGLFFVRQMGRLRSAGIPVYLLYGNHDAESEMTRSLELPDNVHVFSSRKAQTFRIEHLQVALHGRSFKVAATTENLLPGYPEPVRGWFNIGVLHTALEGNSAHARYAPCSLAELQAKAYAYWALGHVHEHWLQRGAVTLAYPGCVQGRHIREPGAHGALLLQVDEGEITHIERVEVDVLRWHTLQVDIGAATERRAALRAAALALEQLLATTPARLPLAVRVQFTGRSAAHAELLADEAQLRQDVIAQALALDTERLWIEKVVLASTALEAQTAPSSADAADALTDLAALAQAAKDDAEFVQALQADWAALLDKLPHELLLAAPELQALRSAALAHLPERLQQASSMLVQRVALGLAHGTTHVHDTPQALAHAHPHP